MEKPNDTASGSPNGRFASAITWTLISCISVAILFCFVEMVRFAISFNNANTSAKRVAQFAPRGSIAMTPAAPSYARIVLDQSDQTTLSVLTQKLPIADQLLTKTITAPDKNIDLYVDQLLASLKTSELPPSQLDRRLQRLLNIQPTSTSRRSVQQFLLGLTRSPGSFPPELISRVAKHWIPLTEGSFHRQVDSMLQREMGPQVSSQMRRRSGSATWIDLTPAQVPISIASDSVANDKQPSENRIANARPETTKTQNTSRDSTLDAPAVAQLIGDLNDPQKMAEQIAKLRELKTGDLRDQLIATAQDILKTEATARPSQLSAIPIWIDTLAVQWEDATLLESVREFLANTDPSSGNDTQVRRVISLAVCSNDRAWVPTILQWLPQAKISMSLASRRRTFVNDSWPSSMVATIDFLCRDDCDQLLPWLDRSTISGAIAREVLRQRSTWSEAAIDAVAEWVGREAKVASSGESLAWLIDAHVDEKTRGGFAKRLSHLESGSQQHLAWRWMLPVIDPFADSELAGEAIVKASSDGRLHHVLHQLISGNVDDRWISIADAVRRCAAQPNGIAQEHDASVARSIDARLAGHLLRKDVGSGTAFLTVAENFGGWATAQLLQSESVSGDSEWTREQIRDVIQVIDERR